MDGQTGSGDTFRGLKFGMFNKKPLVCVWIGQTGQDGSAQVILDLD